MSAFRFARDWKTNLASKNLGSLFPLESLEFPLSLWCLWSVLVVTVPSFPQKTHRPTLLRISYHTDFNKPKFFEWIWFCLEDSWCLSPQTGLGRRTQKNKCLSFEKLICRTQQSAASSKLNSFFFESDFHTLCASFNFQLWVNWKPNPSLKSGGSFHVVLQL